MNLLPGPIKGPPQPRSRLQESLPILQVLQVLQQKRHTQANGRATSISGFLDEEGTAHALIANGSGVSHLTIDRDADDGPVACSREEVERGHGRRQEFDNPLGVANTAAEYEFP